MTAIVPSSSRALVASHNSALSFTSLAEISSGNLLAQVDLHRIVASLKLRQDKKASMGQFLTPASVAQLMAEMFNRLDLPEISLLDAGAGIGSLLAAFVAKVCQQPQHTSSLRVVAYEIDPFLIGYLHQTLELCNKECQRVDISFNYEIRETDFIEDTVKLLQVGLLNSANTTEFTHAILNPPYLKINANSKMRELLRSIGLETSNLYTGFMAATAQLLKPRGEFVAITPRSFCNGPYFRDFRKMFLEMMALQQVHLFESRQEAFSDDDILQETIIIQATKQRQKSSNVIINTSSGANDDLIMSHSVPYTALVKPDDLEQFIHIIPDNISQQIVQRMELLTCTLKDLGLTVSTGRVVDFRAKEYLMTNLENNTVPLIYPVNLSNGYVEYPKITKKPQGIVSVNETANLLIPNEHYVLCKRFSSKEEKRRVVAVVYDANQFNYAYVGFENHLNYFHKDGRGLSLTLARGLAVYLNSTLVDAFFRLFNGHTQVNATDLRKLKYPNLEQLLSLGTEIKEQFPSLQEIDELIENQLLSMSNQSENNPIATKSRIDEARQILTQLGFPGTQRSPQLALTLLALLDLKPTDSWQLADSPSIGIKPMMDFMTQHYGKTYKPNTRESVRDGAVHSFLDAALIVVNPDDPSRPTTSRNTVYQIENSALELLRTYGTDKWEKSIGSYLISAEPRKKHYVQKREISGISIVINEKIKTLSPGGQNILIEKIIKDFVPRFTPSGKLIYVGDTAKKFFHFDKAAFVDLGVNIDFHGKIPDVIIHFTTHNWLVLIEAVTSQGAINPKRKEELEVLFRGVQIPLVMVTTFLSRKAMKKYLPEIAWETDVWVAEDLTHLIHFNGEYSKLQAYQIEKK
ncbi:BsuBI/PstI family type II restriction endonuclease [Nostoc sp.]|uniref:BsuBI/PstI family type II restriction endonuclease n=1 Tax=Nostoc sp. TaxID=1180 RepID=UPI002FF7D7A6